MVGLEVPRPKRAVRAGWLPALTRWRLREHHLGLAVVLLAAALLRLSFAGVEPGPGRFWDERYSFRNVAAVLIDGRSEPAHALYPSLSFLPQTAVLAASERLHRATGREELTVFASREERTFSAHAYRLARWVSVAFGLLGIWFTYRLGRRLYGGAVGVTAALLLAAFWRHVTASVEFKPDALAAALVVLSCGWSLEAVRRGSWGGFLLAGAGVGLATAAKYNAAAVALVLVAAVAFAGRRGLGMLPKLAAAGVASLAVFTVLNPWPARVLSDFRWQLDYYERTAAGLGSHRGRVLLDIGEFFVRHHGWVVAAAAAVGAALLARRALRDRRQHWASGALLAFALGYPLWYVASTELFLSQNLLPVAPLTALFAAWAIVGAWRRAAERWRPLAAPAWRYAGFAGLLVATLWFPMAATYGEVVPTAEKRAGALLAGRLEPVGERNVWFERKGEPIRARADRVFLPVTPVEDLTAVDPQLLDLADAVVFPAERLASGSAPMYLRRLTRPGVEAVRLEPEPFRVRGRPLAVVLHPWHRIGDPLRLTAHSTAPRRWRVELGGRFESGDVVSFAVTIPRTRQRRWELSGLRLAGEELSFDQTSAAVTPEARFLSRRTRVAAVPAALDLVLHEAVPEAVAPQVEVFRWRPPGSPAVESR